MRGLPSLVGELSWKKRPCFPQDPSRPATATQVPPGFPEVTPTPAEAPATPSPAPAKQNVLVTSACSRSSGQGGMGAV